MRNMRFTENLKKRFIFLLTTLVLLQVVPMGAIAQKAASSPKATNQQSPELQQDPAEPQEESRGGNSWRSKLATDLDQSVDDVTTGRGRDKLSRGMTQIKEQGQAGHRAQDN